MENWAVSEADPSKGWNMTMNRTSRPVMTCFDLSSDVFSGFRGLFAGGRQWFKMIMSLLCSML